MKATGGASRNTRAGYGGMLLIFVLAGLSLAGVMLAPNLVLKVKARNRDAEEKTLAHIRESLINSIELTQVIPSSANWSSVIAPFAGRDQTEIEQVFPAFPSDTNTRRVLLIDPDLTGGLLPFTQGALGLTGSQTNLIGANARAMIVSNTRRGLAMPVSGGSLSASEFDAIWDWTYDPATKSPPSGWPSAWSGFGDHLHVSHLNLANQFHRLTLENLQYSLNGSSLSNVTTEISGYFLRQGLLKVHRTAGELIQARVILHDETFRLPANTTSNIYYLTGNGIPTDTDGIPCAQLTNIAPTSTTLPNYDPWRDAFAGMFLHKGGSSASESDPEKVQKWITSAGSITINGAVTLTLYSAMKDFNTSKKGQIQVFLVDCTSSGASPTTIASKMYTRADWDTANSGTWVVDVINFGSVSYTISPTRRLGVILLVHNGSGDDMWFAYGTSNYSSRLTLP